MTHYLRDGHVTVADVDCGPNELRSTVIVKSYSYLLLDTPEDQWAEMIDDFERINELRGEWWEKEKANGVTPDELARAVLREIGKKWDLWYVTD